MSRPSLNFSLIDHERAAEVNAGLLKATRSLGGCVVYMSSTSLRYEVSDPADAIDWLISAEIINPVLDDYMISGLD